MKRTLLAVSLAVAFGAVPAAFAQTSTPPDANTVTAPNVSDGSDANSTGVLLPAGSSNAVPVPFAPPAVVKP